MIDAETRILVSREVWSQDFNISKKTRCEGNNNNNTHIETTVNEFWRKAASQRAHFFTGDRPVVSIVAGCSSRAVMPLLRFEWSLLLLHSQDYPFLSGISAPSSTWFLGLTWVSTPNGISIGSDFWHSSPMCPIHRHRPRYVRHL